MEVIYWLPTHGDSRYFGSDQWSRGTDQLYLQQVAQAIDFLGFDGMYLGIGSYCEDPWIVASSLINATKNASFLIAVRPSIISPTVAARMTATFDRISNGRIALNIVPGASPAELASDGVFLSHDQRHEHADEFIDILKQLLLGNEVNYHGRFFDIDGAKLAFPSVQQPAPNIYCVGSSELGQTVAAKRADVYLTFGERPHETKEIIHSVRQKAHALNRKIRFAVGFYVIVRETEAEAWQAADNLIKYVKPSDVAQFKKILAAKFDSHGQRRQTKMINENPSLRIGDHLWAGTSLVNIGPLAVVGNPDAVVACLQEYIDLGVDILAISGVPHLEEAYQIAELVLPRLRQV